MAYREDGSYFFDPNIDSEDRELVKDELKRQTAREYVNNQRTIARQQGDANDILADVLKEEGIDHATYLALMNEDEGVAKEAYRESLRHVVRSIKKGRGADGKFTKATAPANRNLEASHHQAANPERMAELKQLSNTRPLTESEQEEAIDNMIGKLF